MRARLLGTHAMLLDHFLIVARDRGDEECAVAARRVARWLETTLYAPRAGLFRGAQGTLVVQDGRAVLTSAESARMRGGGHRAFPAPQAVGYCPTQGNARAAAALLASRAGSAACTTGHWHDRAETSSLHVDRARPHGFALDAEGRAQPAKIELLADYAELGLALLQSGLIRPAGGRQTRAALPSRRAGRAPCYPAGTWSTRKLWRLLCSPPRGSESGAFFDIPPPDPDAPDRMLCGSNR